MIRTSEEGNAVLQGVFGVLFLCVLFLGTVQVALSLYGRNVVASSAHEGARAVVELGGTNQDAIATARETVERAAGGLVEELDIGVSHERVDDRSLIRVTVEATLRRFGIVPVTVKVRESATAVQELIVR